MEEDTSPDADSRAVLAAHLRKLENKECASLVADLWREQGYEVTRSGTSVTAVDGARTTTIHVGEQPQTEPTPDVLVTRDGKQLDTTARVVNATALAERMWYAIDRAAARDLCRRHFGRAPSELRLPLALRMRRQLSDPQAHVIFTLWLCTLLVVVAGVGAVGLPGPGETVSPTGTEASPRAPETTAGAPPRQTTPPGVDDRGIDDLNALSAAHQRAVTDRLLTIWIDSTAVTFENGRWKHQAVDTTVTTDGDRYEIRTTEGTGDDRQLARTLYHDGNRSIIRIGTGQNVSFRRYPTGERAVRRHIDVPTPPRVSAQLVPKYLSTPTTNVTRVVGREGRPTYQIVGTGQPRSSQLEQVSDYAVTATVAPDGFVTSLSASYTVVRNGTRFRVTHQVTYGRLNSTTVTTPGWYERQVASRRTATAESALSVAWPVSKIYINRE